MLPRISSSRKEGIIAFQWISFVVMVVVVEARVMKDKRMTNGYMEKEFMLEWFQHYPMCIKVFYILSITFLFLEIGFLAHQMLKCFLLGCNTMLI